MSLKFMRFSFYAAAEQSVHRVVTLSLLSHGGTDSVCALCPQGGQKWWKGKAGGCFHWPQRHLHCCKHADVCQTVWKATITPPFPPLWTWTLYGWVFTSSLCQKKMQFIFHSHAILCYFTSESFGLNWRAILHMGVFSVLVHQSRNKDLQLFCALHEACGTGTHTKQQHVIKNWIPSPVFKIFMQVACAELKWRIFCVTLRKSGAPPAFFFFFFYIIIAGVSSHDTSAEQRDPVFRWLPRLMSHYSNRTQHLWESGT